MKNKIVLGLLFIIFLSTFLCCEKETINKSNSYYLTDSTKDIVKKDTSKIKKRKPPLGKIIESLPTEEKVIALTFDACEYKKPSYFDYTILNFIIKEKIPVTIFVSGRFALRNKDELSKISKYEFIEIENHSLSHFNHSELLNESDFVNEVKENENIIKEITGKKTKYFRFPGGNYDNKSLNILKSLNYPVIHWSFVSGDFSKKITPRKLYERVIKNVKSGSILIFHINGRGYSTGEALPLIYNFLKENNFKFVKLEDIFE